MTRKELFYYLYVDLYRNTGKNHKINSFIKLFKITKRNTISRYLVYFRLSQYFLNQKNNNNNIISKIKYKIIYNKLKNYQLKMGIEIEPQCKVGQGIRIPHFGGIVINSNAVIGKNCEILQGVTIGNNILKDRFKVATIGDNVFIGAGAKIIGDVNIGNNVTIGANSVVSRDIENNVVVAGIPAKVISSKSSIIINSNYLEKY